MSSPLFSPQLTHFCLLDRSYSLQIDKGEGFWVRLCSERKGEFADGILVNLHIDLHALGHENGRRFAFGGHRCPYQNCLRVFVSSDDSTIGICSPDVPCNNVIILTTGDHSDCKDFTSKENDTVIRRRLEAFDRLLTISAF